MFNSFLKDFLLVFIPLFVALDALGTVPFFMAYAQKTERKQLKAIVFKSTFAAFIIGISFVLAGEYILKFLGVDVPDFKIAGGLLLLIFSIQELLKDEGQVKEFVGDFSIVPLAIPLMIGPAMLTSLLVFKGSYSIVIIAIALAANLLIAALMFWYSSGLLKVLGKDGMKAVGKISSIVLAAFAVMLVRKGVIESIFN